MHQSHGEGAGEEVFTRAGAEIKKKKNDVGLRCFLKWDFFSPPQDN